MTFVGTLKKNVFLVGFMGVGKTTVARRMARSELRTADIDGIGAVIHGGHGRGVIFGGSQEFDGFHECGILHKNKTISGIVL